MHPKRGACPASRHDYWRVNPLSPLPRGKQTVFLGGSQTVSISQHVITSTVLFPVFVTVLFRTDRLIQGGVGFGVAEHSVKALQIALSRDSLGGGVGEDGKLSGYGISFNFRRDRDFGSFGHFYDNKRVGLWLAPDGPHEGNHQGSCQDRFAGLSSCPQITGVNCNAHEQNHAKKSKFLPSVSGMGFDTFTFNITLINELENVEINRKTCNLAVASATQHPHVRLHACRKEVWTYGRCFCEKPLMRSFDNLGKLRITRPSLQDGV